MNSDLQGLGENEELQNSSSSAESPQSPVADAPAASDLGEPVAEAGQTTEEAAPATSDTTDQAGEAQPDANWLAEEASDQKALKRGDVVDGTVTITSPTAVYVDVGGKTDGVIPGRELERMNRETLELLKPGAIVSVFVVNPHDHNGELVLSLNRALEEIDWRRAEEYKQSQQVYESHVAGYNKGGLIVRFGRVRGFVPQSQLSADRRRVLSGETPEERWGKMVNEPIAVKVMEVDRSRNRLILSERAASRESRESRKESLIGQLHVGEVRTGRVVSVVDFGAFVDIGGAEGLVHLTELSWTHVTHPKELLQVGQEVRVEVISVDPDSKRIGLSLKRQEADPWDTVASNYAIGQLVRGTVTKLTKFGVFVRLTDLPEIEGLIHISELSDQRVNHPREVVQEDETLTLRVVKIDVENRRLGLSLKRVNSAEYLDMDWSSGGA
jgi:small subunit ribosomal protein S1